MWLSELRLANVRNVADAEISLHADVNEFVGANGAGKTSVLEAAYMLSHGRSFRSVKRESLIRFGEECLSVFAEVRRSSQVRRLGLSRRRGDWAARLDGQEISALAELLREVAVVCFEPGSHSLISGGAEERRRFVDWALFHVEHSYVDIASRYRRALKQRNALLRSGGADTELDIWDHELETAALRLTEWRAGYIGRLEPVVCRLSDLLVPELGQPTISYQRGWGQGTEFIESLRYRRSQDRERGHTSAGPHRADWRLTFAHAPEREHLSRGQEKLTALVCVLAQGRLFKDELGDWPIVCLDDLASELDSQHQRRVLEWLDGIDAQILITGTSPLPELELPRRQRSMFHVEQGIITRLL